MSVLIRGMQMPQNCIECKIKAYDANAGEEYCPFTEIECLSIGRQENCPLVELPEKHGWLVDQEDISKMIKKPFNFFIGIFCGMCFVINLVNHRDMFVLSMTALATVLNITIGLTG